MQVAHTEGGWQQLWTIREGTTYLNHGSFGPSPEPVPHCAASLAG